MTKLTAKQIAAIGLRDRIPDTPYTPEDLCRVKILPKNALVEPGMIVVTDGAWQRKHLVTHVTFLGDQPCLWGSDERPTWMVGLRMLGYFFADNRFEISPTQKLSELRVQCEIGVTELAGKIGSHVPCLPIGSTKSVRVAKPKITNPQPVLHIPLGGGKFKAVPIPQPKPEAVLDSFRIKSPGGVASCS